MSGLLYINGYDFTNHILMGSWKVNNKPVYTEWTDYGKKKHKHFHRNKVSGSFKIYFSKIEDYNLFFNTLRENTNRSGYTIAELFLNNEDKLSDPIYVSFDYDIENYKPIMGVNDYDGFEIKVEER